jgi:hypothetical protein
MLPSRVAGFAVWTALSALLVSCGAEKTGQEVARNLRLLDPEIFRAEIQSVDALLFRDAPLEAGEGDAIAAALERLAVEVGRKSPGVRSTVSVSELRALSRAVVGRGEKLDRGGVRREWIQIRTALFVPATWFATEDARVSSPLPTGDVPAKPATADYRRALSRLEALMKTGRREMGSMGELSREAALDPGQLRAQTQLWEDLESEWSDDLNTIEGSLPDKREAAGDPILRMVHDDLESAIAALREVPLTPSARQASTRGELENRLAKAEEHLQNARRSLYDSK